MLKEYEEIDFIGYVKAVKDRKKTVISMFVLITTLAVGISFLWPKTFEAEALIRLGIIKGSKIETIENIKDFFGNLGTLKNLAEELGMQKDTDPRAVPKKFDLLMNKSGSGFLKVRGRGETPEKALEILNKIVNVLIDRHSKFFSEAKKSMELEIDSIKKVRQQTDNDIAQIGKEISRLEVDATRYGKEISLRNGAETEAQGLIAGSYINLLADTKSQIAGKRNMISDLRKQLIAYDNNLQQKEYEKTYQTTNTAIEIAAILPETPISPKKTQNVIIAAILGLFIGVFYALTAEYFSKNKINGDK